MLFTRVDVSFCFILYLLTLVYSILLEFRLYTALYSVPPQPTHFTTTAYPTMSPLTLILLFAPALITAQTASTITVSAAPLPTSPSYTDADSFQKDMLTAHNFYRGEHGVKDLVWNETSADFASDWAEGCRFVHSVSFPLLFSLFFERICLKILGGWSEMRG